MIGWPSSIRARLALWHSILLGLPLVVFAIVCYVVFSRALVDGTDRFIAEALAAFTRELGAERRAGLSVQQAMISTVHEVRFRELHIMILNPAGQVVAIAEPPDTSRAPGTASTTGRNLDSTVIRLVRNSGATHEPVVQTLDTPVGAFRVRTERLDVDGQGYALAGRYPLRDAEQTMKDIQRMFSLAIPLLILAAAFSGYFLALRSLAPVAAMAKQATDISASNLHERLPVGALVEVDVEDGDVHAALRRRTCRRDRRAAPRGPRRSSRACPGSSPVRRR